MPKWKPKHPGKALPPQYAVAKSDGNDAVQAWIDLLPEWQTAQARRVDAVVTHVLPEVHKAVKWHGVWYACQRLDPCRSLVQGAHQAGVF